MYRSAVVPGFIVAVLLAAGCSGVGYISSSTTPSQASVTAPKHDGLNAALWTQTAVEFEGLTRGMYSLATLRLEEALADTTWTASLEQLAMGNYTGLPTAVILDVDETVLDNSPFQARLVEDDMLYNSVLWNDWVREEKASPIPGALEFTRYAASRGVAVFYVTNRDAPVDAATRNNLAATGFPLDPDMDTVITQGEREEWRSSDKTPRRAFVAKDYRILLLIGDNFGDFTGASRGTVEERSRSAEGFAPYWGKKWIVLPNPQYGSWEAATFDFEYGLPENEKRLRKYGWLRTER